MSVTPDQDLEGEIPDNNVGLSFRRELARKGLHLLSAVVPIGYAAGLTRRLTVLTLVAALAVAAVIELARSRSARARLAFDTGVGFLLREHERSALSGATWLILALLIAVVAFPRDVAIAAMCAVCFGDAIAAIAGRTLQPRRLHHGKSFIGSLACFGASAIAARTIANLAWKEAVIVGVFAALAERPRRPLDDNLRITLAVGCGILLWRMGFS